MDIGSRQDLKIVYSHMSKAEKRRLAEHLGKKTATLRRYCMEAYSSKVSKPMQERLLNFYDKDTWDKKYASARVLETSTPIQHNTVFELHISAISEMPEKIILNNVIYKKEV